MCAPDHSVTYTTAQWYQAKGVVETEQSDQSTEHMNFRV